MAIKAVLPYSKIVIAYFQVWHPDRTIILDHQGRNPGDNSEHGPKSCAQAFCSQGFSLVTGERERERERERETARAR